MTPEKTNPVDLKTQPSTNTMPDVNQIIEIVSEHDNISDIHMSSDNYVSFRTN